MTLRWKKSNAFETALHDATGFASTPTWVRLFNKEKAMTDEVAAELDKTLIGDVKSKFKG